MKRTILILLHIGYWLLYSLLILLIMLCLAVGAHLKPGVFFSNPGMNIFFSAFAIVPALIGFYLNYGLLFDRYLAPKKTAIFFFASIVTALLAGLTGTAVLYILYLAKLGPGVFHDGLTSAIIITSIMAIVALLNGVVGLVMKGFISWYGDIKLKEDLASKNHAMELALVKAQIDPHFLFNTINNIDVMIEMDAVKASAYLNKLSGIMRFMLYETKTGQIPLQKELDYIRQYISLQQIRVANPDYVRFSVSGKADGRMIHAMLFIPFIENAFKHISDNKSAGAIDIEFIIEANNIIFTCKNICNMQLFKKVDDSGIGNDLIQRRLTLLYGPKHQLGINHQHGIYSVTLDIETA